MIFVDTAYFIARANARDALQARAVAWDRSAGRQLLVTEYVLWEVVNHFSSRATRSKGHLIVSYVRQSDDYTVVPASPNWFERGMQLHAQRLDKEWSLTDCVSFVVMRDQGLTEALTSDHHFEQAGFGALLLRDP